MAKRRDFATFGLLFYLVSLSWGDHSRDLEVIFTEDIDDLAGKSIEARCNQLLGEGLENKTTVFPNQEKENFVGTSMLTAKEMELEDELEEALEDIVSSGGVVSILTPTTGHTNSTSSLILIDSSLTSRSPIDPNDVELNQSRTFYDQEISQSRTRARSIPVSYADKEDIENIEDLLAITEYEPQKIDTLKIEGTKTQTPLVESSKPQLPEEMHYDIPRRRNVSKNTRSNNLAEEAVSSKINTEGFMTQVPLEITSRQEQFSTQKSKKGRGWFRTQSPNYSNRTGREKSTLTSKLRDELINDQQEGRTRESRQLKPQSPPLFPRLSKNLEKPSNYSKLNGSHFRNVSVADKASKKKVGPRSIAPYKSSMTVPTTEQNKVSIDDREAYSSTVYPKPNEASNHPIPNDEQLGFLTRYNMPSLLMPRLARFRPYSPVTQRIAATGHFEVNNDETFSSDENRHPRTYQPNYEGVSGATIEANRITSRTGRVISSPEIDGAYQPHKYQPSLEATLSKNASELLNPTSNQNLQDYGISDVKKMPELVRQRLMTYPGFPSQANIQPSDYAEKITDPARSIRPSDATVPSDARDRRMPEILGAAYVNARSNPSTESNSTPVRHLQTGYVGEIHNAGKDFSELSANAFGTSSSHTPYDNPQRTPILKVKTASSVHEENSDSEAEKRRIDGAWKNASPISNPPEFRHTGQHTDRSASFVSPEYDFYEQGEPAIGGALKTSPSNGLQELISGNYGKRLEPLIHLVEENLQPRTAYRNGPSKAPIRLNVEERVKEKTVGSLRRGDAVDHQDQEEDENEDIEDSSHEENREASMKDVDPDEEDESEGGGEKHEEGHHAEESEKAKKGYKERHEYDKGAKGHVDKENHEKEYDEKKGDEKKHEDESGYHKEYHHGEKGNKESEFGEKGEHEKGHSTKGQHIVHKKDEYEKKTEFYDESHEEDGDEKEGGYHYEHENEKGGHEKIGHHDSAYDVDKRGERAKNEKGRHWNESSGHDDKEGHERDHHHEERFGKAGFGEKGEKWSHKSGDNGKR